MQQFFNHTKANIYRKTLKKLAIIVEVYFILTFANLKALAKENVLIIHSYSRDFPNWTNAIEAGINEQARHSNHDLNIFHEFLDAKRHPNLEHSQQFLEYLAHKYQNYPLDVLMVSDDPGLDLVLANREKYFPKIPLVFLGINHVSPELMNTPGITGVFENRDVYETIVEAHRQTQSDTLIIINDTTQTGEANLKKIREMAPQSYPFQDLVFINDLSPDMIDSTFSRVPSTIPVLLIGQLRHDSQDKSLYNFAPSTEILHQKIANPIYALNTAQIGQGIVGGKFLEGETHAKEAVKMVERLLNGVAIDDLEPIVKAENQWIFDAQELKKHHIELQLLPPNSKIINHQASFYQQYRGLVWLTLAAFIVSLLIILLLMELIRRGTITEKILRENEIRYKDLAQAGANIFWETDALNRYIYLSGDTQEIYHQQPEQIIGKSLSNIFKNNPNLTLNWDIYENILSTHSAFENFQFSLKQEAEIRIFLLNGKPVYNQQNIFVGYRGILRNITQEYNLSQTIAYQASYDSLTGLINRREFNSLLSSFIKQSRDAQKITVLCYLDLDHFKLVNDTAGHSVGDSLLVELANILRSCIQPQDILGRLGGDEFALLLVNSSVDAAQVVCQNIITKVENYKYSWNNRLFDLGISIGLLPIDQNASSATELLSKADLACYKAKDLGRGRVYISDSADLSLSKHRLQMECIANVSQAIAKQQFHLVKQVIKSANSAEEYHEHYEILLRYTNEDGNMISPGEFIPIAEKYGVITIIDRWVLDTALSKYQDCFADERTMISINLSGITIGNEEFVEYAIEQILQSSINPSNICFEITETAAISQISQAIKFMTRMKSYGIKFALDDFGSGVSSFGYLKSLPVDYLKIDGSLIRNLATEPSDRAIVYSISSIAEIMNLETIAEFVEDKETRKLLADIGVNYVQGYGIGKPIKLEAAAKPAIN